VRGRRGRRGGGTMDDRPIMEVTKELGEEFHAPSTTHVLLFVRFRTLPAEDERPKHSILLQFLEDSQCNNWKFMSHFAVLSLTTLVLLKQALGTHTITL
jgi:hypothetical protein